MSKDFIRLFNIGLSLRGGRRTCAGTQSESINRPVEDRRDEAISEKKTGLLHSLRSLPMTNKGFTLMELLLALTLFAIVASSSASIFRLGLDIWARSQGRSVERKVVLALERMGQDIRSSLKIKNINSGMGLELSLKKQEMKFGGETGRFSLPTIVSFSDTRGISTQFGRITYAANLQAKGLCRMVESATDIYKSKQPPCVVLATHLSQIKFEYWLYDRIAKQYSWYDRWEETDGTPMAIRVSMKVDPDLKAAGGRAGRLYQKTILVPTSDNPDYWVRSGAS